MESLKFVYESKAETVSRSELGLDFIRAELAKGFSSGPTVYVVRSGDCDQIRQSDDCIENVGVMRQKGKELSRYLLGRKSVPMIEAQYTSLGRLRQSIALFLHRADKSGERKIYIVAVSDSLFELLWDEQNRDIVPVKGRPGPPTDHGLLDLLRLQETPEQRVILGELGQTFAGDSDEADLVRHLILKAAQTDDPVLILGETGTGKELVARAIHNLREAAKKKRGYAADARFIAINCAAIPNELLESELFGHKKGAFTTASAEKKGLWEAAAEGTLFLDEIAEMPLEQQTKVLRALQGKEIRRLGSTETITVCARIISATNQDLATMMQAKLFRDDLYHRLSGLVILTPPLRRQPEQISRLARFFWKTNLPLPAYELLPEALAELESYPWPGNIRELKKVLGTLKVLFDDRDVGGEELRAVLQLREITRLSQDLTPPDIAQHRAQSLQCLHRAADVISALNRTLAPLGTRGKLGLRTVETIQSSLRTPLAELEVLCLRPLLFRRYATYDNVVRLRESLSHLSEAPAGDFAAAADPIIRDLGPVLAGLFSEVEELLAQG